MSVLVVGDLHFQERDPPLYKTFIKRISTMLEDKTAVILLGDIQHKFKTVDRMAQTLVCELFKTISKKCKLYVLVGNHDYDNASQFLTENHTLAPFKSWKNVIIIDSPTVIEIIDHRFLLVPYIPKGRFMEAVQDYVEGVDIVFAHQEFLGSEMGPFPSIDGDPWPESFPLVISGHAHGRHKVGKNIQYVGMPYDDSYDESLARYFLVLDNQLRQEWIETRMPKKQNIVLSFDEAMTWLPEKKHSYRLGVVGTTEQYKEFCKARKKLLQGVVIRHVSTEQRLLSEALQKRKQLACGGKTIAKYPVLFKNLVNNENSRVQSLYKNIIDN